jgi:hypothetical protein
LRAASCSGEIRKLNRRSNWTGRPRFLATSLEEHRGPCVGKGKQAYIAYSYARK